MKMIKNTEKEHILTKMEILIQDGGNMVLNVDKEHIHMLKLV